MNGSGRQARLAAGALGVASVLAMGGCGLTRQVECSSQADCPSGSVCDLDQRCVLTCNTTLDCQAGAACIDGRCVDGAAEDTGTLDLPFDPSGGGSSDPAQEAPDDNRLDPPSGGLGGITCNGAACSGTSEDGLSSGGSAGSGGQGGGTSGTVGSGGSAGEVGASGSGGAVDPGGAGGAGGAAGLGSFGGAAGSISDPSGGAGGAPGGGAGGAPGGAAGGAPGGAAGGAGGGAGGIGAGGAGGLGGAGGVIAAGGSGGTGATVAGGASGSAGSAGAGGATASGGAGGSEPPLPVCGDGLAEPGLEDCDGADLGGSSCQSLGFAGGALVCLAGCQLDLSGCTNVVCGDGVVTAPEQCDTADGAACSTACTWIPRAGGSSCTVDAQCLGGLCLSEAQSGWPGGFCTARCGTGGVACSSGMECAQLSTGDRVCVQSCTASSSCRDGYSCFDGFGTQQPICHFDCDSDAQCDGGSCEPFRGACDTSDGLALDGAPCTSNADCESRFCLDQVNWGLPGGMCTSFCDPIEDTCAPGDVCGASFGLNLTFACLAGCTTDADCRAGYRCSQGGCIP